MGAMQGQTPQQSWDYIKSVLWEMQKVRWLGSSRFACARLRPRLTPVLHPDTHQQAQWVFWIPVQLLNFNFVPVRHQLNVVLCTSIVWTALLSMWYPPIETDDDAAADRARKELAKEVPVM